MFRYLSIGFLLVLLVANPATADPTGTYRVTLTNPGTGARSEGTVTVSRMAEAYRVIWRFGGRTETGVALGGAFNRGDLVFGPAHSDDMLLAIGFHHGSEYGNSTMIMQPDGTYSGYRVDSNGQALQERWLPGE